MFEGLKVKLRSWFEVLLVGQFAFILLLFGLNSLVARPAQGAYPTLPPPNQVPGLPQVRSLPVLPPPPPQITPPPAPAGVGGQYPQLPPLPPPGTSTAPAQPAAEPINNPFSNMEKSIFTAIKNATNLIFNSSWYWTFAWLSVVAATFFGLYRILWRASAALVTGTAGAVVQYVVFDAVWVIILQQLVLHPQILLEPIFSAFEFANALGDQLLFDQTNGSATITDLLNATANAVSQGYQLNGFGSYQVAWLITLLAMLLMGGLYYFQFLSGCIYLYFVMPLLMRPALAGLLTKSTERWFPEVLNTGLVQILKPLIGKTFLWFTFAVLNIAISQVARIRVPGVGDVPLLGQLANAPARSISMLAVYILVVIFGILLQFSVPSVAKVIAVAINGAAGDLADDLGSKGVGLLLAGTTLALRAGAAFGAAMNKTAGAGGPKPPPPGSKASQATAEPVNESSTLGPDRQFGGGSPKQLLLTDGTLGERDFGNKGPKPSGFAGFWDGSGGRTTATRRGPGYDRPMDAEFEPIPGPPEPFVSSAPADGGAVVTPPPSGSVKSDREVVNSFPGDSQPPIEAEFESINQPSENVSGRINDGQAQTEIEEGNGSEAGNMDSQAMSDAEADAVQNGGVDKKFVEGIPVEPATSNMASAPVQVDTPAPVNEESLEVEVQGTTKSSQESSIAEEGTVAEPTRSLVEESDYAVDGDTEAYNSILQKYSRDGERWQNIQKLPGAERRTFDMDLYQAELQAKLDPGKGEFLVVPDGKGGFKGYVNPGFNLNRPAADALFENRGGGEFAQRMIAPAQLDAKGNLIKKGVIESGALVKPAGASSVSVKPPVPAKDAGFEGRAESPVMPGRVGAVKQNQPPVNRSETLGVDRDTEAYNSILQKYSRDGERWQNIQKLPGAERRTFDMDLYQAQLQAKLEPGRGEFLVVPDGKGGFKGYLNPGFNLNRTAADALFENQGGGEFAQRMIAPAQLDANGNLIKKGIIESTGTSKANKPAKQQSWQAPEQLKPSEELPQVEETDPTLKEVSNVRQEMLRDEAETTLKPATLEEANRKKIAELQSVIDENPESFFNSGRYRSIAILENENGDNTKALQAINRAVEIKADAANFGVRGRIRRQVGDFEGSLRDFDEAISSEPGIWQYRYGKGKTLVEMGQDREALKEFDRVVDRTKGESSAEMKRGSDPFVVIAGDMASAYERLGEQENAQEMRNRIKVWESLRG